MTLDCKGSSIKLKDGKIVNIGGGASDAKPHNPFIIAVAGRHEGAAASAVLSQNTLSEEFVYISQKKVGNTIELAYRHVELGLTVVVSLKVYWEAGVFCETVRATNDSKQPITITHLSSALVCNIGTKKLDIHVAPPIKIHYFESTWQGEARYRCVTAEECGIMPVSTHHLTKAFRLSSVGSYSTAQYLPLVFLEDTAQKLTWFVSSECEGNWHIEVGHICPYIAMPAGFYIEADSISLRRNNRSKTLEAGESVLTSPSAFGCVEGGFNEAVAALTSYHRAAHKKAEAPLIFNDYMNCLWGQPTREKLLPLIDTAAAIGAEGFCIDAGWYGEEGASWGKCLGDWIPSKTLFGSEGLEGIVRYINDKNMLAGVWTELEVCGEAAIAFSMPDNCFLTRFGKRIGGGERCFFNFENKRVTAHLTSRIKDLNQIGVRYIKNDYNDCIGAGADGDSCLAEMLARNHSAAMSFYESLMAQMPDLIIENCSSGAMRCDYGTLKHFNVQSTSDQEIYELYPPIVQGSLATVLPEQAGIWSYPYPHLFDVRGDLNKLTESISQMRDGRQTVFNMVSGLAGVLYLSGRIDVADEYNRNLIKEGCNCFKEIRDFKREAYPVYPNGFQDIYNPNGIATLGLYEPISKKMLLYVWRLQGEQSTVKVDLSKWFSSRPSVKVRYPLSSAAAFVSDPTLSVTVTLKDNYSAVILEIEC